MPTVNAPPSVVRVAPPSSATAGRAPSSRLRRAAAFVRLVAADAAAIAGAFAAILPLLPRRRPIGRAAAPVAPPAAGEPERTVVRR